MLHFHTFSTQDPHYLSFQSLFREIYGNNRPDSIPLQADCYLALKDDEPVARLTTRIVNDMRNPNTPCGLVGHYESIDSKAGIELLGRAQKELKKHTNTIIGPMNDSPWDRYRLALPAQPMDQNFDPSTFLGEPRNPPEYHSDFIAAGFSIAEHYESRIVTNLLYREKKRIMLEKRMDRLGISIRPVDLNNYENELHDIFTLSIQVFSKNPFYRPIDFSQFKHLYEGIKPYLNPEFILIARNKKEQITGFTFNYTDLESMQAKKPPRLVIKTLAVDEKMRGSGLALFLLDDVTHRAYKHGYQSVIHALMHSDNDSLNISQKGYQSALFKRYALYGIT